VILLDTDHTTYLKYPDSDRGRRLIGRMQSVQETETFGVAIVTVEERMRGWLAVIAKEQSALRQVVGYRELTLLFEFYHEFEIAPFDEVAARNFERLRGQKLRIGTRDLKIAATALVNNAVLLSANRADFERVPGLRVVNWLECVFRRNPVATVRSLDRTLGASETPRHSPEILSSTDRDPTESWPAVCLAVEPKIAFEAGLKPTMWRSC